MDWPLARLSQLINLQGIFSICVYKTKQKIVKNFSTAQKCLVLSNQKSKTQTNWIYYNEKLK